MLASGHTVRVQLNGFNGCALFCASYPAAERNVNGTMNGVAAKMKLVLAAVPLMRIIKYKISAISLRLALIR